MMPNDQNAEQGLLSIAPQGRLYADFSTTDSPLELDLVDPASGHIAQFAKNDLLRITALGFPDPAEAAAAATIAHKFWLPGGLPVAVPCDVWLKVTAVSDEGTHFRYTVVVQQNDGPNCRFLAGTPVVGYGQATDERILITAVEPGSTYIDLFRTGLTPWQQRESLVRVGRLDDLAVAEGEQTGIAIGATLQQPGNPHLVASTQHLKLSQVKLEVDDGQSTTVRIDSNGGLRAGTDVDNDETTGLVYDSGQRALSLRGALAVGGEAKFAGPLSINEGEVTRVRISANGDIKAGSDVDDPEQTRLHVDTAGGVLSLKADLYQQGGFHLDGDLSVTNAAQTTAQLGRSGELRLGPDVSQENGSRIHYDPTTETLAVSALLRLENDATTTGSLNFEQNGMPTISLGPTGSVAFGADTRQPESTAFRYQSDENAIHISAPLTLASETTSRSALRLVDEDRTTIKLDSSGEVRIGSDVETDAGTAIHYDPAGDEVRISSPVRLNGAVSFSDSLELSDGEHPTVRINNNGDVQYGTDVDAEETTGFEFRASANELTLRSDLQLQGATISRGTLQFRDNSRATVAISASGDLRLGTDISREDGTGLHFNAEAGRFDLSAELHLSNDSHVGGDLHLEGDAALLAGVEESVRVDRDGIQLRLEPGENNSIKIAGIGRAALINAFQTTDNIQQLDVLAYYNRGAPTLHGSLRLGVADAAGGEPDMFLRMTRFFDGVRKVEMDASQVIVHSDRIQLTGDTSVRGNFDYGGTGGIDRVFRLRNLPTSSKNLPSGAVWNDGGTLKIVL